MPPMKPVPFPHGFWCRDREQLQNHVEGSDNREPGGYSAYAWICARHLDLTCPLTSRPWWCFPCRKFHRVCVCVGGLALGNPYYSPKHVIKMQEINK